MDFPNLKDNSFPHLQNVDVYANRNTIDYSEYTTVKNVILTHVLWDNEYDNVVDWCAYDGKREQWFAEHKATSVEVATGFAHPILSTIKLPLSYTESQGYNYLYYELPILQNEGSVLDFQPAQKHTFYYFVTDTKYIAPNTTEFHCQLDVWTTWIEDLNISYMQLERGHYAVANSAPVGEYLQSPVTHTDMLLADDVVYGSASGTVVSGAKTYPLEKGGSYVVFVSTMGFYDFNLMCATEPVPVEATPADWDGGDPADYEWGFGGYDYTGYEVPRPVLGSTDGRLMGSLYNYAVDADLAGDFIAAVTEWTPQFLQTLQCAYAVRKEYVYVEYTAQYDTYTVGYVHGVYGQKFADIELSRDLWNYDARYADLTKLYTAPYSLIEIEDGNGKYSVVEPEKCGKMDIQIFAALCYPTIHIQATISGLCGDAGGVHYNVVKLSGHEDDVIIPSGDWSRYLVEWDVPCFAIFITERDMLDYTRQPLTDALRFSALNDYHNTERAAATDYQNTVDAANTTYTNAVASADAALSNETDSANTQLANVTRTNAASVSNTADGVAAALALVAYANALATDQAIIGNSIIQRGVDQANITQNGITQISNNQATATAVTSGAMGIAAAGVGFLSRVAVGDMAGAVSSGAEVASALVNTASAMMNAQIVCDANSAHALIIEAQNAAVGVINSSQAIQETALNNAYRDDTIAVQNTLNTGVTARNTSTSDTNAAATNATAIDNATLTRDTIVSNAARTQSTAIGNAARTRDMRVTNAQYSAETAQVVEASEYERASHAKVAAIGTYAGDLLGDVFSRRSVRLKVRTMQTDAIRQNGDYFLRYGYAYNGNVDVESLQVMKHYSYWKCKDLWVTSTANVASTIDLVRDIFIAGVTVWTVPDEIGRCSIYDN